MKTAKRTLVVLATLLLCLTLLAVSAFAAKEVASGTCGENLTWVLDNVGTLTISGTGDMNNYSTSSLSPWHAKCTSIRRVVVENGVTSIGSYAFYFNLKMESVSIGNSVTRIGAHAFDNCTKLTAVTIPDKVTSVGDYAFKGCKALKEVTVGCFGKYMFCNCSALTDVTIRKGVTKIGYYAFHGCSSLTSVVIPEGVTSLEDYAFNGCKDLSSVTIPSTVSWLGFDAFAGCAALERAYITDISAWLNLGMKNVNSNPLYQGAKLYFNGKPLTAVVIPDNITTIRDYAFYNCSDITSVTFSDSVTAIGNYAFRYCVGLSSVVFPESVTSIGFNAFNGCTGLTSVVIADTVSSIGYNAFRDCTSLKRVSVTDLESWMGISFGNAQANPLWFGATLYIDGEPVKDLVIPESVTSIDSYVFAGFTGLTSIKIPESVTSIAGNAFSGCGDLTEVEIAEGVTSIGSYAFSNCVGLTEITIPDSVTDIGAYVFYGCSSLESITIPSVGRNGVKQYEPGSFWEYRDPFGYIFGKTEYPGSVPVLQEELYYYETNWWEYYIPAGLTSVTITGNEIAEKAFKNCTMLKTVVLSQNVTNIDDATFSGCDGLTDVYYAGSEDDWAKVRIGSDNTCLTDATIHYNHGIYCSHEFTSVVTAPTCTEGGYTTNTCVNCGYSYTDRKIKAPGHSYLEGACKNCGYQEGFLPQPAISKLENKDTGISIKWDAVPGAEYYQVFVKVSGGWKAIGCTRGTSLLYTGVKSGEAYCFTIRSKNAQGEVTSTYSRTGWQITYIGRPSIAKLENTAEGIKITWNAVTGAEKYKLMVKTDAGWKTIWNTVKRSYTWTGAESGKSYTFGICCTTSDGKTVTSAYDSTGKTIQYIAQPTINKVANTVNGVAIAWTKVPGAVKYKIVVKTATSGWKTIAYSTGSTYTWTGATSGVTYTFGIRCVTSDGKTYTSSFDSVGKSIKYIAAPRIAKLEKVSGGIKITWNKVAGAEKYKLVVKEPGGSWKTIWNTIKTSYTWTGAVKGKTYIFSLRCMTADGKSYTSSWNSTGWTIKYN